MTCFPTDLESQEKLGILLISGENDVYCPSCVIVVPFCWKTENTHSVHVITKW